MKFRSGLEICRKGKGSYFTLPQLSQGRMHWRSNSLDYMPAPLMLPAIGEGKLAHFEQCSDVRGGDGDLDWRDTGSGGSRSFPRPRGSSPTTTGRTHSSPQRQLHRHSDPSPPDQHRQLTETVVTLLPSHLNAAAAAAAASSPPDDRPRRAYFHLRSDDTGERSGSNLSLSDWRDTSGEVGAAGGGELPRLATQSRHASSADSNARHSSGVFVLPTDPIHIDSPRFRDHRARLGRGSQQWSPVSKDSVDIARENSSVARLQGPTESNVEPTSSRVLQTDRQDLQETSASRGLWTSRQRTSLRSDVRPGEQGNTLREGYRQERTFIGVTTKVNPLTRMNQILSKSNTNLSRSDLLLAAAATRRGNNTSNLQRHCSEMNLQNRLTGYDGGHRGPTQHHQNTSAHRPGALTTLPNRKMLIKSQSQPVFRPGNDRYRLPINRKSIPMIKNNNKNTPEAEEKTKEERIIEWLLDIDGYAEPPDSPIIFEDGPLQSDTAIHVVYEGD